MLESYSDRARLALAEAQEVARAHGQSEIRARHLLIAVAGDPRNAAARILARCEVGLDTLRDVLDELDRRGTLGQGHMPFSADTRDLLTQAVDEMRDYDHEVVSTAVLLQVMVKNPNNEPTRMLERLGVPVDRVRAATIEALHRGEQDEEEPGMVTVRVVQVAAGPPAAAGVVSPTTARRTDAP